MIRSADLMRIVGRYMEKEEASKVYQAFLCAAEAHDGVYRQGGEPYITHPIEVACILADLHMDADGICAAILHDVIEDTPHTKEEIADQFGDTVADLVDGVTKFEYDDFATKQDALIATFRKMMGHMTKDYRVVMIKIADRIHNLRTIKATKRASQKRKATETFNLYIPLARRMGMNKLRRELEELAFVAEHPWRADILRDSLTEYRRDNEGKHNLILEKLTTSFDENGMGDAVIFTWEKNIYRLHKRLEIHKKQGKKFKGIEETLDLRILVKNTPECYQALGIVHQTYLPKSGEFNDYIAAPKVYGFQALQTVIMTPGQQLVNIQIQTQPMFQISQYGVAAKWRYPDLLKNSGVTEQALDKWLRQVSDIHDANYDPMDFYQDMQADLFLSEIQVYTPNNKLINLPHGSTPIDFAYSLHTDIGDTSEGALIDGNPTSLKKPLPNGSVVEIIRSKDHSVTIQPSWLSIVKTAKARSSIRHWLNSRKTSDFIALGKRLFDQGMRKFGFSLEDLTEEQLEAVMEMTQIHDETQLWLAFGKGEQCSRLATKRLFEGNKMANALIPENEADAPLLIQGTDGLAVNLQTCCHPIPGDAITAKFTAYGLDVHRSDCRTLLLQRSDDMQDELIVSWAKDIEKTFLTPLNIRAQNKIGVLSTVTLLLARMNINIEGLSVLAKDNDEKVLQFLVKVRDLTQLQQVIRKIIRKQHIIDAERPDSLNPPTL
jgi:RelA/SpoT family (p)ppGpp synthetase